MNKEYLCPKCNSKISIHVKADNIEYFGECLECDEDFYKVECISD